MKIPLVLYYIYIFDLYVSGCNDFKGFFYFLVMQQTLDNNPTWKTTLECMKCTLSCMPLSHSKNALPSIQLKTVQYIVFSISLDSIYLTYWVPLLSENWYFKLYSGSLLFHNATPVELARIWDKQRKEPFAFITSLFFQYLSCLTMHFFLFLAKLWSWMNSKSS